MSPDASSDDSPSGAAAEGSGPADPPGTPPAGAGRSSTLRDGSRSSLVNALLGAAAGILLSFVPFSPALGGGVAGYLEGGDTDDGLRVGLLAGVVMAVPFTLFGLAVLLFFVGVTGTGAGVLVLLLLVVLLFILYTVGLGAVGGIVGAYLAAEV